MGRMLKWGVVWLLSLGTADIDVRYSDGLRIKFNSWPRLLREWWRRGRTTALHITTCPICAKPVAICRCFAEG